MAGIWRRRANDWPRRAHPPREPGGSVDNPEQPMEAFAVLEHLAEGVVLVDADRSVGWLNPVAARLLSAIDQPVGRLLVEVIRDHRLDALAERARESGDEQSLEIELPVSGRILQVRAIPLEGQRAALIFSDVSRLRYLETVRQQFVANLSHEIRTPLAGLDLAAQTLAGQLPADGDARTFIDRVIQESQRLQAILHNLTQLAALDAEGIQVERARFRVAGLVGELIDRYQGRAAAAGLQLRAEAIDAQLEALGDRGKADQALQNIVDNALKFTKAGEVVVGAHADHVWAVIAVRDTGPGIPPRDLPRIFERFYKVDRARGGQPGTGLGLSIARHLIELQGGTITADSIPGSGSEVTVRLPRPALTSP
ncbi:MAG TPA: ATP-binding protein [Candidatus Dormibacteraeota bacterium]|jgi:two-component system phosphate regulon sensor histidine kinase PhoR|nr:ATP-binding protein [Candidatus Dormibacteraeota bacterium]